MASSPPSDRRNPHWFSAAGLVMLYAIALAAGSFAFGLDTEVVDMAIWPLTICLCVAGAVYLIGCLALVRRPPQIRIEATLGLIFLVGLIARLILFASVPTVEVDYLRYLWDGGVTAFGFNPYLVAPAEVHGLEPDHPLQQLAANAGPFLTDIGHAQLKTIYPPVAQGAFALAHWIKPWSLDAWRLLILCSELTTFILLVALLRALERPPIWAAIYWWNPLILKELFNSAHMDALLIPFVLLALYAAIRRWHLTATASISLAVGIKIWPLLLIPVIWRPLLSQWRTLCVAIILSATIIGLMAAPFVSVGLDASSGLVAYASTWRISAPLYGLIEMATAMIKDSPWPASTLARAIVATCIGIFALSLNLRPARTPEDLVRRATLIIAALLFLSPAIYPWYVAWLIPLLALTPIFGLLLLTATAPLYYTRFFYGAGEQYEFFEMYIVWWIWVPVWLACGYQLIRHCWPIEQKIRV